MKKICFVIPYFGPFPFWIEYFWESCRYNSQVDFLLYTDNACPQNLPANIRYQHVSFSEYKRKVSQALNIHFDPPSAYKLCDIKPAYGLIHAAELQGYDFWGFCDLDLVFGRLQNFVTEDLLASCDLISAHGRRVSGHFCVMRNVEKYTKAFMQAKRWRQVFEDHTHHCFDEKAFSDLFIGFKGYPGWLARGLRWLFRPYGRKALFVEQYSTPGLRYNWVDGSRNFPTEWYWRQGTLTNNAAEQEFMYFHFLAWKRLWNQRPLASIKLDNPTKRPYWRIDEQGFTSFEHESDC